MRINVPYEDKRPESDYRIRLNGEFDLDIPDEMIDTSKYCATLAHKVKKPRCPKNSLNVINNYDLFRRIIHLNQMLCGHCSNIQGTKFEIKEKPFFKVELFFRFGLIRAIASLSDIKPGEEIFVNYNMPLDKVCNQ